jgi:hypothetical protein
LKDPHQKNNNKEKIIQKMLSKTLTSSKKLFSTLADMANHRVPLVDPEDGEKLDNHLNR